MYKNSCKLPIVFFFGLCNCITHSLHISKRKIKSAVLGNSLYNSILTLFSGKALFQFIGEMIPKLKSRQSKSSQSDSSGQQQGAGASSKKKKGKKGKGK